MKRLWDFQETDVGNIRAQFLQGAAKVCYTLPTGGGKTVVFVHIALRAVERGHRVCIIVHRGELIEQTCRALTEAGVAHGVIAAGYPQTDAPVQVAMAQTLANRLDRLDGVQFLIVDECHHALAETWLAIVNAAPIARVLGCTATPERLDGKGLAEVFDALVIGPSVKELITGGYLSPFICFAPERTIDLRGTPVFAGDFAVGDLARRMNVEIVTHDALVEYRKRIDGQSAIAFCVNIEHSRTVARHFRTNGVRARHLDGDTPTAERRQLIAQLATGEVQVITNCNLIAEGLDVPSVGGVILLRPTKSLALFLQQIGRALRPAPGKMRAVILDHAGNVFRHGLPDLEHAWSLEGRPKKKGTALVRRCPECEALIPIASRTCPKCGATMPAPARPPASPTPLVEVDPANAHQHWLATGMFKAVMQWAGDDEVRLREIARARGYKSGWVWHRLNHRHDFPARAPAGA
jgi:DNA repair protein RadD